MPEAYTVSRKIELMRMVEGQDGLASFAPKARWLGPMTKCNVAADRMLIHGLPYVKVRVLEGPHAEQEGYIPRHGIFHGYVGKLLVKDGAVVKEGGTQEFTGVKYGAYTTKTDYKGLLWAKGNVCKRCGKGRGDHKLLETRKVREELLDIIAYFRAEPGSKYQAKFPRVGRNEPFMMGLLVDAGYKQRWFAMSGKGETLEGAPKVAEEYCLHNKIKFVKLSDIDDKRFVDFFGRPIEPNEGLEEPYVPNAQCAAPKLLQYVLQKVEPRPKILYLSEIWFGKKKEHELYPDQATIDSCDFCRLAIPPMLCGYENPYKKSAVGRPGDWQSFGQLV